MSTDTLTDAQQRAVDQLVRYGPARLGNVTDGPQGLIHHRTARALEELGIVELVPGGDDDGTYASPIDGFTTHLEDQGIDPDTMDDEPGGLPPYLVFVTEEDGSSSVAATETAKARAVKLARGLTDQSYGPVTVTTSAGETVEELDGELEPPQPEQAPTPREPGDRWGRGHLRAPRTHAVVSDDVDYRADRIPAGATHHVCDSCAEELPVTKYPTTSDGSRRTECRSCRDARRAASA